MTNSSDHPLQETQCFPYKYMISLSRWWRSLFISSEHDSRFPICTVIAPKIDIFEKQMTGDWYLKYLPGTDDVNNPFMGKHSKITPVHNLRNGSIFLGERGPGFWNFHMLSHGLQYTARAAYTHRTHKDLWMGNSLGFSFVYPGASNSYVSRLNFKGTHVCRWMSHVEK